MNTIGIDLDTMDGIAQCIEDKMNAVIGDADRDVYEKNREKEHAKPYGANQYK